MAPKKDNKKDKNDAKKDNKDGDPKKKGKGQDKKITKRRCSAPIATGTVMAQRVLPPTVCCPPSGCSTRSCLPGPGCGRC